GGTDRVGAGGAGALRRAAKRDAVRRRKVEADAITAAGFACGAVADDVGFRRANAIPFTVAAERIERTHGGAARGAFTARRTVAVEIETGAVAGAADGARTTDIKQRRHERRHVVEVHIAVAVGIRTTATGRSGQPRPVGRIQQ